MHYNDQLNTHLNEGCRICRDVEIAFNALNNLKEKTGSFIPAKIRLQKAKLNF